VRAAHNNGIVACKCCEPRVVKYFERSMEMELTKFIMWLTAGAVVGWIASRIVSTEHRLTHKPKSEKVSSSEKS
jgi:hypothetical protein